MKVAVMLWHQSQFDFFRKKPFNMTNTESIYRSILMKISTLPPNYLEQVDAYLQYILQESTREKHVNRKSILALVGGWNYMSESSFDEYLNAAKNTGKDVLI